MVCAIGYLAGLPPTQGMPLATRPTRLPLRHLPLTFLSFPSLPSPCPVRRVMSKELGSTAVYAYTTLISVLICVPLALIAEGSSLTAGIQAAIAKVGATQFWGDLFAVGMLYHLYNQVRGRGRGEKGRGVGGTGEVVVDGQRGVGWKWRWGTKACSRSGCCKCAIARRPSVEQQHGVIRMPSWCHGRNTSACSA